MKALVALAALAQESRLAVFRLLVERGPKGQAVGKIAEHLRIPLPTLSFHLKELHRAELVVARQEGRFIFYSANFRTMTDLIGFLTEDCCGGNIDQCLPSCEPPNTQLSREAAHHETLPRSSRRRRSAR